MEQVAEREVIDRATEILRTVRNPERFTRFSGIVPPVEIALTTVNVIGCGGIGSWVTMGLACLGVKLNVFDADQTETHNFGGQPLPRVGESKVRQLHEYIGGMAEQFRPIAERFDLKRWEKGDVEARIMVSGVDSIESRRDIWEAALAASRKKTGVKLEWYVDGRMGGTNSHVITVDLLDKEARERYEKSLEPKGGFTEDACSMRSTVFAGMGCAAEMVGQVARILQGKAKSGQKNTDWLMYQHLEGWTA